MIHEVVLTWWIHLVLGLHCDLPRSGFGFGLGVFEGCRKTLTRIDRGATAGRRQTTTP